MLCNDVKRVVYFYLDGTLSDRRDQDFRSHVSDCHDCEQRTIVHRRLREFVHHRLTVIVAPDRFKVRLSRSLRAMLD